MNRRDAETHPCGGTRILAVSPPPAPPAELLPPPPHALLPAASSSNELTPRTSASISSTVPRQYPRRYESQNRSLLATQVWEYFDDTGFETTLALGVAGHSLRAQHKCRCMYCDAVVRATPVKMASHVVFECRIADAGAKRALRTGKTDLLTTMGVANPHPKPSRPRCDMVAPISEEPALRGEYKQGGERVLSLSAAKKSSAPVAIQASAPVPDYVGVFKWEASEIRVQSCSLMRSSGGMKEVGPAVSLEEAVKQAEQMIFSEARKAGQTHPARFNATSRGLQDVDGNTFQSKRVLALRTNVSVDDDAKAPSTAAAVRTPQSDKENMPPSALKTTTPGWSTAKKRQLEAQERRTPRKLHRVHEPAKKRLFDGTSAHESNDQNPPSRTRCEPVGQSPAPSASKSRGQSLPPSTSEPINQSPPHTACDVDALIRGLTITCITENVPLAFLGSVSFESTIKSVCGVPESVDFAQGSSRALEEMAERVDAARDAMKASSSQLTFVVQRASPIGSNRAVVYLVDESAQSVLISCQQGASGSGCGVDVWLDEVRRYYLAVSGWCGRALHVCVSGYPTALQHELLQAITSSTKFDRLFGGCMAQDFALLRQDALALLQNSIYVVQRCAELALLVNEAEKRHPSRRASTPAIRLSVPSPRDNQVFGHAVLLTQLLVVKDELVAKYQVAAGVEPRTHAGKESDILCRVKEILDSIRDHWWVVSDTLQRLLPLAAAELLKINSVASSTTGLQQTSGSFFCVELWLLISTSRCQLLTPAEKSQWKALILRRFRAMRVDHQLAGLILDPRTVGAGLSAAGRRAGRACVVQLCRRMRPLLNTRNLAPQLADYVDKAGIFGARELWSMSNTANPMSFWRGVQDAPELREVALLVCSYAPASPAASDEVQLPGCNYDQASRAAQVRHYLQARAVIRDPASIAPHAAVELLKFLIPRSVDRTGANLDDGALGSRQVLFDLEQFSWSPDDPTETPSPESILHASQAYAMTLKAIIDDGVKQSRGTGVKHQEEAQNQSTSFQLSQFSESWIDCSEASLQAIHDAISSLSGD